MTAFRAALFDLDGTLLDSMGVWEKVDVDFLAKRGFSVPADYVRIISAMSFTEAAEYTISRFALSESAAALIREWNDMVAHEYRDNIRLKPYAREYLAALKSRGIKLATATSLSPHLSEAVLKNNAIYEYFDCFSFTDEVNRGKEFPDVFLLASEKLVIPPRDCIVFEDLLAGIKSAKQLGMRVFCVHDKHSRDAASEIMATADGYLYDFKDAPLP